jgi:hypothetical protein
MQAIKQAAREGDSARLDFLCEEWSVSAAQPEPIAPTSPAMSAPSSTSPAVPAVIVEKKSSQPAATPEAVPEPTVEVRR